MQARSAPAEGVATGEGFAVVRRTWHGQAGAHRVAGAQQCAEVGRIGDPEGRHDQVVPAAVLPVASASTQIVDAGLGARHRIGVDTPRTPVVEGASHEKGAFDRRHRAIDVPEVVGWQH